MNREEAALILDPETSRDAIWSYESPEERLGACNEACRLGAAALREQEERENPKPLNLYELMQMDGEPVWVVCSDLVVCALVEVCEESIFLTNNLGGRTEYACQEELEDDGITVYRSKPGTEPGKPARWIERIDTDTPMHECSVCGARVVKGLYEYENPNRYCYHCGARMDIHMNGGINETDM